jgi:hypothetical protein
MNRWYVEGIRLILAGPGDAQIAFAPDGAETHRSDDGRWRLGHWYGPAAQRRHPTRAIDESAARTA